jgi:cell division protein ZapD
MRRTRAVRNRWCTIFGYLGGHSVARTACARTGVITYEYPLTERIRTLLRLEDLFGRARHFLERTDPLEHHVALVTMFEIMEVCSRSELKSELLQELERLRQSMAGFRGNNQIDQDKLAQVLGRIEHSHAALLGLTGKIGQHLRNNEWLMSIRQRTGIPGGACEFDLPTYHHWLHRAPERRNADLEAWMLPLRPIEESSTVALGLLRDSGQGESRIATRGQFQQMMAGRVAQMVRVRLDDDSIAVPEISANRYALNIRFVSAGDEARPRALEADVPFSLTFCNI